MSKLPRYYASYVFEFPIAQNKIDNDSKHIMCPFWHPKVKGVSGWNACRQGMLYIFHQSFFPLMQKELQLQDGNTILGHNMYTNWCDHIDSTILTRSQTTWHLPKALCVNVFLKQINFSKKTRDYVQHYVWPLHG